MEINPTKAPIRLQKKFGKIDKVEVAQTMIRNVSCLVCRCVKIKYLSKMCRCYSNTNTLAILWDNIGLRIKASASESSYLCAASMNQQHSPNCV